MIGNDKPMSKTRPSWLSRLSQDVHHYIGVDGGSGAHLLADLAGRDPYLQQVSSPRHADLLLVIEPISQKLAPAVVMMAEALAYPARIFLIGEPRTERTLLPEARFAQLDNLFPNAQRIDFSSIERIVDAVLNAEPPSEIKIADTFEPEETTIQLPTKQDQEMATELAVLSFGPLQAFTAGPLRLFLICDGEQVFSVQMETEYATRGINSAITQGDWQQGLLLARQFDPLAPIASQLVYVEALEQLQGWQRPAHIHASRALALVLERVQNTLWWLVRFARLLADSVLSERSYRLARQLAELCSQLWLSPPEAWILPQYSALGMLGGKNVSAQLQQLTQSADALRQYVEQNRGFALRTRSIGVLTRAQLKQGGIERGPVYDASEHGRGDVQSRLVTRLQGAVTDLRFASEVVANVLKQPSSSVHEAVWDIPVGETTARVVGPRGDIDVHLVHQETQEHDGPTLVEWHGPSARLVALLPELLVRQKLADAEVILASLDLVMAEVDG